MADIELVIKIPKELYESYKGRPPMLGDVGMDMIAQSIANGTPLPEGHKLIDADALYADLTFPTQQFAKAFRKILDDAPTMIIPADKDGD